MEGQVSRQPPIPDVTGFNSVPVETTSIVFRQVTKLPKTTRNPQKMMIIIFPYIIRTRLKNTPNKNPRAAGAVDEYTVPSTSNNSLNGFKSEIKQLNYFRRTRTLATDGSMSDEEESRLLLHIQGVSTNADRNVSAKNYELHEKKSIPRRTLP